MALLPEDFELPEELLTLLVLKNTRVWDTLWNKLLVRIWGKNYNKNLPIDDIRGNTYAKRYFEQHGMELVKTLSDTDALQLKNLISKNFGLSAREFVELVRTSFICSDNRLLLIYKNEIHMAEQNGAISKAYEEQKKTKTRHCMHERSCLTCISMDGEVVPIDGMFSDGTKDAHTHPDCRCNLTFGD